MTNLQALINKNQSNTVSGKVWLYSKEDGLFLAIVDARGSCSLRMYSEADGAYKGIVRAKGLSSGVAFADVLSTCTRVNVTKQPNLEDATEVGKLDSATFDYLIQQIAHTAVPAPKASKKAA